MEQASISPQFEKDHHLWAIAKKRAALKYHLANYLLVNAFLWALWYFTGSHNYGRQIPWPIYPTLGWGIGLCFHYLGAYVFPRQDLAELEYKKLLSQNEIRNSNKDF